MDVKVLMVIAAYRASRHEATGYTPNFLMYGREVRDPIDLAMGAPMRKNTSLPTNSLKRFVMPKNRPIRWQGPA